MDELHYPPRRGSWVAWSGRLAALWGSLSVALAYLTWLSAGPYPTWLLASCGSALLAAAAFELPHVLAHEFGHWMAARVLGARILGVQIGTGAPLARWRPGNTPWLLRERPTGGMVVSLPRNDDWRRHFAFVLGGPLASLLLAALPFLAWSEAGWPLRVLLIGNAVTGLTLVASRGEPTSDLRSAWRLLRARRMPELGPEAALFEAALALDAGEADRALDILGQARRTWPSATQWVAFAVPSFTAQVRLNRAVEALEAGEPQRALEAIEAAERDDPSGTPLTVHHEILRCEALRQLDRTDDLLPRLRALLQRVGDQHPTYADLALLEAGLRAQQRIDAALDAWSAGRFDDCVVLARQIQAEPWPPALDLSGARNAEGIAYLSLGRWEEGRRVFAGLAESAGDETPDSVWNNLALAELFLGNGDRALALSSQVLERRPGWGPAVGTRGAVLVATGDPVGGRALLLRALAEETSAGARAWLNAFLACAAAILGDTADARDRREEAVQHPEGQRVLDWIDGRARRDPELR